MLPPPSTTPCVPCVAENGNKNSFRVCALCFYWACIMLEPTSSTLYACKMDVHAMVPTATPPPPLGRQVGGARGGATPLKPQLRAFSALLWHWTCLRAPYQSTIWS